MMTAGPGGRSIGQLLRDLASESADLVRGEIALAKAELTEKAAQAAGGVGMLVAGSLVAFAGLLVLLDAAVYGLARLLGTESLPALAALIVGAVTIALGGLLVHRGRTSLKPRNLAPARTAQSLERDRQFVKEQMP
ncbi:MAG TPA: phage holin family protein [Geminicoccaceae bacterium]